MGIRYEFVTRWEIDAPLADVYDLIARPLEWPQWWRAVVRMEELAPGTLRSTWRTRLPYGFTFDMRTTRVQPCRLLEASAEGDLCGVGRWTFDGDDARTHVRYDWQVETTKRWMRILAPIARPAFEWNHDVVMGWGLDGLRRRLGASARSR